MPDAYADPIAAFDWMFSTLEKDLKESKMWPIRLASHKHQEKLRHLHQCDDTISKLQFLNVIRFVKETFANSTRRLLKKSTSNFKPSRWQRTLYGLKSPNTNPLSSRQDQNAELDLDALTTLVVAVETIRDAYLVDAASAANLCKPKGGKKRKDAEVG